jgi:hypothetical protein
VLFYRAALGSARLTALTGAAMPGGPEIVRD